MENYNPRIYVADLSAYNDGRLVGEWIDLKKFNSGDEVMKEISSLLKKWSNQSGEVREEFAIHDYEDIPESIASEYMNKAEFDDIYKMLKVAEEYNLPVEVLDKAMSELGDSDAEIVANQYIGSGESYDDYVIETVNEDISYYFNEDYFDTENYGASERINASTEEEEEYGYDDMTDEEIGDFLLEVNGGYDELSAETKEMYFDYDRYGRDLSFGVEVISFDSQVYVFNKNYAKGGYLRPSKELKTTGEYLFKTNSGKEYRLNVSNFERVDETNDMLEIQDDLRQELGAIIIDNSKWRILAKKGEVVKATTSTGIKGKIKKVNTFELGGQLKAFAKGGSIENNYGDHTAKEVWNKWTESQREHFLADHYDVLMGNDLGSKNKQFDDLARITQVQLDLHLLQGQYAKGGQLEAFAVGGKVGSEITFNSWDDEKRMGTIQEVLDDGSYAVSVDTGMVLVYPSDVVEYNKPVERKKLFGIFANGGRTNERRHVNKSEDYEVRYAKNHPHRTGYKGNQKYANGGATDNNGSIDRYFSKLYFPNASASKSKNNISVYYKSSYNYDLSIDFDYNLDGDLKSAVIIHEIKEWEYNVSDATQIGGFENSQMYFDKLQEITTNVVNKNLSKIKTELEETNEENYIPSDVLEEALKHALKSVYIEWHNTEEFAKGGVTDEEYIEEYIDYFEDYDLAPPKVQKIMNEYEMKFIDGDNEDVKSALKEFSKIGYTFDVDLDNQPYDLRPIGTKGKSKMYE
jgi:antirestriction protein